MAAAAAAAAAVPAGGAAAACAARLRTHGFTVLEGCIPPSAIPALAAELAPETGLAHAACAVAHALPDGHPDRSRSQIAYLPLFAQHVANPVLLEAARAVFHDTHVRVAEVEFMGKCVGRTRRGSQHRGWHTDWPHDPGSGDAVGAVTQPPPDVCMSLSTIWYLSDVDTKSGGTWTVPGSFHDRRNPRGPQDELDDRAPIPTELQVAAPAGSVFIQDSRNWHSTPHNPSDTARLAVVVRYAPSWMNVEHGTGETGYYGSNTAWVPRASWLQMPPAVQDLFRHRADGVLDELQLAKVDRHHCGTAMHAMAPSEAECIAAEEPMSLHGSPYLQAELEQMDLLTATLAACATMKEDGCCMLDGAGAVGESAAAAAAAAATRIELASLPAKFQEECGDHTAALIMGAPHSMAQLSRPLIVGTAKALLDTHIKVANVSTVTLSSSSSSSITKGSWRNSFPHHQGHASSWVEEPFPPARMGLVVMQCFSDDGFAVEVLRRSHRRLLAPGPSDDEQLDDSADVVWLRPGKVMILDSRLWWRPAAADYNGQHGARPMALATVIVPWWVSLEFPRRVQSSLRGWGGLQLPRGALETLPPESQELVRHMVVGEEHRWQPSKHDETKRANEHRGRPERQGNQGIVPGRFVAAAQPAAAAGQSTAFESTTLKVVLVRHGQSTNTEVATELLESDDHVSEEALERNWLAQRDVDPCLTPQGQSETARLCTFFERGYLSSVLDLDDVTANGAAPDQIRVSVRASPMWRALQTAKPLAVALQVEQLLVDPDLAELGGHFGGTGAVTAAAPSVDEIVGFFGLSDYFDVANIDVARLPAEGGWDAGRGYEGWAESRERAARVAASLIEIAVEGAADVVVLVSHDGFIKLLLATLMHGGGDGNDSDSSGGAGQMIDCELLNTATTAIEIDMSGGAKLLWLNRVDHFLLAMAARM